MLPSIQGVQGSVPSTLMRLEKESENISLRNIVEGKAPDMPSSNRGVSPLSLASMRESGAFPVNASALRSRKLERAASQVAATLTLDRKALEDSRGARILTAYRLITTAARITGDLPTGPATLSALPPDKFYLPSPSPMDGTTQGTYMSYFCFRNISQGQNVTTFLSNGELVHRTGLTLLPPPIPDEHYPDRGDHFRIADYRNKGYIPESYRPETDEVLTMWLEGMRHLSDFIGAERGTEDDPNKGYFGLLGMLSPKTARLVWPSRDDILNFEQELMFYTGDLLFNRERRDQLSIERQLMEDFGFTHIEALLVRKAAGVFAGSVYSEDREEIRHREAQMLEGISDTCLSAGDPRAALAAQKQKHQLLGLTRHDESENLQEFRDEARLRLNAEEEEYED